MSRIDETKVFQPVNIAVLVVSDSRTEQTDKSGRTLAERIERAGHHLIEKLIVPDEITEIQSHVRRWIANVEVDVVIATGGTGLTGRDVTPEAFYELYDKEIPGFGELFRWTSFPRIGTSTMQSRATAGVSSGTYLFAVPGSPGACRDAWDDILKWQLDSRHRPCNLVDIMPRLMEHKRA